MLVHFKIKLENKLNRYYFNSNQKKCNLTNKISRSAKKKKY